MTRFTKMLIAGFAAAPLALVGCDVEQTEEGRLPDVEVRDTGQLPEYDVQTPEVDVTTQEKTIRVPDVDVRMPDENEVEPVTPQPQPAD